MSRYIRYKYQKQQINFLNCNDLDKWIDTCQTRVIGFDSVCESNCNCGEIRDMEYQPQYRTKKLNPNYSYECVDMDRHYKLQKQISYDNGITWMDIDEYEIGELYESNSPFCSAEVIIYDWFPTGRYKCVGYSKINEEVKRVSFDNGNTWTDLSYVDDNGNVTYEYRFNASNGEEYSCDCGYCNTIIHFVWDASTQNYCEFSINYKTYSATTENSVLNEDGTYTYEASFRDLGITDTAKIITMFSQSSNVLKVYKVLTYNTTTFNFIFAYCSGLESINVSGWDTSKVTSMSNMFQNCKSLTSLDLSSWDISNVTNMDYMFYNCYDLTSLDVSGWNTSNVINMNKMFSGCHSLKTIYMRGCSDNIINNFRYYLSDAGLIFNVTIITE